MSNGALVKANVVQLTTYTELKHFSADIEKSGLAPKGMTAPQIMVAIQIGAERGLSPLASVQAIAVINGRATIWGDAMLGLCRANDVFDSKAFTEYYEGEPNTDSYKAVCKCKRTDDDKVVVSTFTIGEAKRAGLWNKQGPWKSYPERMLKMRARSWALRDTFADVLQGLQMREEVQDYQPERESFDPNKAVGAEGLAARMAERSKQDIIDAEFTIVEETDGELQQSTSDRESDEGCEPLPFPDERSDSEIRAGDQRKVA